MKSEYLHNGQRIEPKRRRIGFIRPGQVETAFIIVLYVALAILVLLSFLGTFYWLRGEDAPLTAPRSIWRDVWGALPTFGIACAIQGALTLAQYGARQFSRHDRRWWILYLVALGISVYYNTQAYWSPLVALGVAWYVALAIIVAGDIVPEVAAVRHS